MAALLKKKGSSDSIVPSIQKGFSVEIQKHQCFFAQKKRRTRPTNFTSNFSKTLEVTKCCRITIFLSNAPSFWNIFGHWREICHTNDHTFRYVYIYIHYCTGIFCKVWLINHLGSLKTTHGECPELCWLKACGDFATRRSLIPASRSDGSSNCQMWTNQSKLIQRFFERFRLKLSTNQIVCEMLAYLQVTASPTWLDVEPVMADLCIQYHHSLLLLHKKQGMIYTEPHIFFSASRSYVTLASTGNVQLAGIPWKSLE